MGYSKVIKPTQEIVDQKLNVNIDYTVSETTIDNNKLSLLVYCMKDKTNILTHTIIFELTSQLSIIYNNILSLVKKEKLGQFVTNKEIVFYGLTYSQDAEHDFYKNEEFLRNSVERLAILSMVVKTDNYFAENTEFFKKQTAVEEEIADFIINCYIAAKWKIIDDLEELETDRTKNENKENNNERDN